MVLPLTVLGKLCPFPANCTALTVPGHAMSIQIFLIHKLHQKMKHFLITNANGENYASQILSKTLGFLTLFFFLVLTSQPLQAQCVLVCNGPTPQTASQVAVNNSCEATLIPDAILESPQSCPGAKVLTVRDDMNRYR